MSTSRNYGLILICEGGAHSVEYFHKNGVYPGAVVFQTSSFKEMVPYLSSNDEVLVVINSLTDFTLAEVYALLNDLAELQDRLSRVTVLSNIDLATTQADYYLYSGDLFYGSVQAVISGKLQELKLPERPRSKKKSKSASTSDSSENAIGKYSINAVMQGYKKYVHGGANFMVYGSARKTAPNTVDMDSLVQKLIAVDLYK